MADQIIEIASEEDAWALLKKVLEDGTQTGATVDIRFKGWPYLEIYLPDTPREA